MKNNLYIFLVKFRPPYKNHVVLKKQQKLKQNTVILIIQSITRNTSYRYYSCDCSCPKAKCKNLSYGIWNKRMY